MQRGAMQFHDDFVPSGDEEVFGSDEENGMGLLLGGESGDEVEFVPPGGVMPAPGGVMPAPTSASAASSATEALAAPQRNKRKQAGQATEAAHAEKDSGRKLVRLASNPKPQSPVVQQMLCITGGQLKHPVPVCPVKVDSKGNQWVVVNEHQSWLRRPCASAGTTHTSCSGAAIN